MGGGRGGAHRRGAPGGGAGGEGPPPKHPPKSSSTTPTTTGFDNIDAKLAVIKEGINNSLAENIKNSSNNLLAVNFVNTMMQGYNDTPIELLNEVKSNLSMSASISSFLRNDIHTSLALASRYASFSFAPKVSQVNSLQTQAFLDNDLDPKESISSFSPSLSNSLWANAFGGANLLGSEVGASYGLNLGYDKNLEKKWFVPYARQLSFILSCLSFQKRTVGYNKG